MLNSRERRLLLAFLLIGTLFMHWAYVQSNARVTTAMALIDDGTLAIDSYANISQDRVFADGHHYSDKAPGVPLIGVPLYGLSKLIGLYTPMPPVWAYEKDWIPIAAAHEQGADIPGVYLIPAFSSTTLLFQFLILLFASVLPGGIILILLYRYLRSQDYSEAISIMVSAGLCLGTFFIWHATSLYGNITASAAGFAAFYLLETRDGQRDAVYAGILAGLAPVFVYYGGLLTAILFAYQVRKSDRWKAYLLGATIGVVPFLIYNTLAFGAPWEIPFIQQTLYHTGDYDPTLISGLGTDEVLFGLFLYKPHHLAMNLINLTIAPSRGVFFYAPIFLLALYGLWKTRAQRRRKLFWTCAAPFLGYLAFNTALVGWEGGPVLGPRYMVPMLPFFAIGIAEGLRQLGPDRWVFFTILLVPSLLIGYSGFVGNSIHPVTVSESTRLGEAALLSYVPTYDPLPHYWNRTMTNHGPASHWLNILSGEPSTSLLDWGSGDPDLLLLGDIGQQLIVLTKPWIEVMLVLLIAIAASVGEFVDSRRQYLAVIGLSILILGGISIETKGTYYGHGWADEFGSFTMMGAQGTAVIAAGPDQTMIELRGYPFNDDTATIQIGDTTRQLPPDGGSIVFPTPRTRPPYTVRIRSINGCHRLRTRGNTTGGPLNCLSIGVKQISAIIPGEQ